MARFRTDLVVIDNGDGRTWTLAAPLVYESDLLGRVMVAPAGMVTDLASVPLLSNHRSWTRAAVIHDRLYAVNGLSRSQADAVLSEAMQALGVPAWRRWIVRSNLRLFGGRAWKKHRARDQETV